MQSKKTIPWGFLATIDLCKCDKDTITSPEKIKKYLKEICGIIKMIPHGPPRIEKFGTGNLKGYSAFQFIETSSITIHCDDKMNNRVFIDIFSCKIFSEDKALQFSKEFFKTNNGNVKMILRY